jgi:hypothetical protein
VRSFAFAGLLLLLAAGGARAEWQANVQAERFRWAETTQPGVTETGPRFGIGAGWTQDRPNALHFAWRGTLYGGSVTYSGAQLFPPNDPVTGTTEYTGLINELQAIWPTPGGGAALQAGLGFDYWNRQLSDIQREEWWVTFARLGVNLGGGGSRGFFAGGGIKYPIYVVEDAHLDDIGFDQNPRLHPKGEVSFYADLGYRFSRQWTLALYYDSYRFKQSPGETVTSGGVPFTVFQPRSVVDTVGLRLHLHF